MTGIELAVGEGASTVATPNLDSPAKGMKMKTTNVSTSSLDRFDWMKVLFAMAVACLAPLSAGASESLEVSPFEGEFEVVEKGMEIQDIRLVLRQKYCNLVGTTCSNGPKDEETVELPQEISEADDQLIRFGSETVSYMKTNRPFHQFSSCEVEVRVSGTKAASIGTVPVKGSLLLFSSPDLKECEDREAVQRSVEKVLRTPKALTLGRSGAVQFDSIQSSGIPTAPVRLRR